MQLRLQPNHLVVPVTAALSMLQLVSVVLDTVVVFDLLQVHQLMACLDLSLFQVVRPQLVSVDLLLFLQVQVQVQRVEVFC